MWKTEVTKLEKYEPPVQNFKRVVKVNTVKTNAR